jgi:fructose-bisphosphate aldolase, class II
LTQECIAAGVSKINVNKLVLEGYTEHLRRNAGSGMPLTQLMEEGVEEVRKAQVEQMEVCWSSGKARRK